MQCTIATSGTNTWTRNIRGKAPCNCLTILTRKSSGGRQANRRNEEKPKTEERESMPQHQHCPPAIKHHGDRNPKYHEEQQKDVA
jgi:hypothetical protein